MIHMVSVSPWVLYNLIHPQHHLHWHWDNHNLPWGNHNRPNMLCTNLEECEMVNFPNPQNIWCDENKIKTTGTPVFWEYPPPPPTCPMITHTTDSYQIPSQNKTKSQIWKICQKFKFWNFPIPIAHGCLIRCVNMKWIQPVVWKLESRHDSVHRLMDRETDAQTDGWRETSIFPFQLRWSGGIKSKVSYIHISCDILQLISPWTKWLQFHRRPVQMNENIWISNKISLKYVPWQNVSIGSDNGLVLSRQQAIIWTNVDPVHWRIYAALEGDELIQWRHMTLLHYIVTSVITDSCNHFVTHSVPCHYWNQCGMIVNWPHRNKL